MDEAPGRRFLIWGGGGHGKVVADLIRVTGGALLGYVDGDPGKLGAVVEPGGAQVIASEEELKRALAAGALPGGADALALAIGHNEVRLACLRNVHSIAVPPLIHPSAVVSPSAQIGDATVVFPAAIINAAAMIGAAAIINSGAIIEHDCHVGDGAHVSPGAVLAGGVRIGERSWVGAGATVIPGVRIGDGVVVGAGAVVIRDVPDGVTVAGVPARPISSGRQP